MISFITFIPLVAAVLIFFMPADATRAIKRVSLIATQLSLILSVVLVFSYLPGGHLQFVERYMWIPSLGIDYYVGVDGLNLLVLVLVGLLSMVSVLASWNVVSKEKQKTYFMLLTFQFTGLYGVFTALSFFHWFLFWEITLVPAFFLIKLFGGQEKDSASLSFFLYTVLGSVVMLLGCLFLCSKAGTYDFTELAALGADGKVPRLLGAAYPYVFFAVMIGLWVKVPLVPLHFWQVPAYTQAPTPISMILTGVFSKMGVYGFLRLVVPIFPQGLREYSETLLFFALLTILWGAFMAMRQKDLKRMLTYSSLNHVAYCMLGIFAVGAVVSSASVKIDARTVAMQGAVLQMFAHGLSAAGLFYMVGRLEARFKTRDLNALSGLGTMMPRYTFFFGLLAFSSLGLPFLAGFAAEFLVFSGSFALAPEPTAIAVLALLATALFLLNAIQRIFTGAAPESCKGVRDITWSETIVVLPILVFTVWVGITPGFFVELSNDFVRNLSFVLLK